MKFILHYSICLESVRQLGERLAAMTLPDYLRDTCEQGLLEAETILAQWHQPAAPLSMREEYQFLDQIMQRVGFVDDMTRDLDAHEEAQP